jgi:hypothetical protein
MALVMFLMYLQSLQMADVDQYQILYSALAKKYPGIINDDGSSTVFQFFETPYAASWVTNADYEAYTLANSTNRRLDGFFVPTDDFFTSYQSLVSSLEPAQSSNAEYNILQSKVF